MSPARAACAWIPGFAAAALARQEPALRGQPVAALAGGPIPHVVAVSPEAGAGGIRPGMSATEAATRVPGLLARPREPAAEAAAAGALLDAAWAVSPRVEVIEPGCCALDLTGLPALWGDEGQIGARLAAALEAVGLPGRVGIGATRTLARLAARAAPGVTVVPAGTEPAFLAPLSLGLLDPPPALAATLERWGVGTLGALARLTEPALLARLGPAAVRLRAQAAGEDLAPFVPHPAPEPCVETLALDWEVHALPGLAFVLDRLLGRLEARLTLRGAGAAALRLTLRLADGALARHRLALGAPLRAARILGRLLLAALEPLRLPAPVVAVTVEAEPAPLEALQADFLAPSRPSPRELGDTLGRLAALVGADRVGAPVAPDTHRPDVLAVTVFPGPAAAAAPARPPVWATGAALVRRRLTPPRPADVTCAAGRPVRLEAAWIRGAIVTAAGPWRSAGEWWADTAWAREEWDVALADGACYRLVRDLATGAWALDAVYD